MAMSGHGQEISQGGGNEGGQLLFGEQLEQGWFVVVEAVLQA